MKLVVVILLALKPVGTLGVCVSAAVVTPNAVLCIDALPAASLANTVS